MSVTIDFSLSVKAFNKLDFPAFGAPTIAILIPFLIVFPGLIAFNLYADKMAGYASADAKIQASNANAVAMAYANEKFAKFKTFDEIPASELESAEN